MFYILRRPAPSRPFYFLTYMMGVVALSKKEGKKTRIVTIFKDFYGFRLHLHWRSREKKKTENVIRKKYA